MKKTMKFVCAAIAALMTAVTMPGMYAYANETVNFEKDGNVDDAFVTQANELLSLLPYEVREQLGKDGWTFVITDKNLSQYFYNGAYRSVAGTTALPEQWIYIEDREKAISRSVIHETGHAIDYELGWVSRSEAFKTIYHAEKGSFCGSTSTGDSYEVSSDQEYFASAWSEYILNPTSLLARTPQTYAFIEKSMLAYTDADAVTSMTYPKEEMIAAQIDGFDAAVYYNNYPDLQETIGYHPDKLYEHYTNYGIAEGRNATEDIR
ncbi:MAG: hypothetical protein LUE86_02225 [Clostridiales bacterium]|nr:hypothetical protein [Clostridiales bacterium]